MKNDKAKPQAASRRGFLRNSALTAVGGGLMLGMGGRAEARLTAAGDDVHSQLLQIAQLAAASDALPGSASIKQFINANYPQDVSDEDGRLLNGALYLQASSMLERLCQPLSQQEVNAALATTQPMERLGPDYFRSILSETKQRVASDPDYRRTLDGAIAKAQELDAAVGQGIWPIIWFVVRVVIIVAVLIIAATKNAH